LYIGAGLPVELVAHLAADVVSLDAVGVTTAVVSQVAWVVVEPLLHLGVPPGEVVGISLEPGRPAFVLARFLALGR